MAALTSLLIAGTVATAAVGLKQANTAKQAAKAQRKVQQQQIIEAKEAAKLSGSNDDTSKSKTAQIELGAEGDDTVNTKGKKKRTTATTGSALGGLGAATGVGL